jgi:hypothetical protein
LSGRCTRPLPRVVFWLPGARRGHLRAMSEYRTPEEDTIGGHSDLDDDQSEEESGSADPEQESVEAAGQSD